MIKVSNISYIINGKKILDNISFEVKREKSLIVVGANGAGKSTLLKILSGFCRDFNGEYLLFGRNVKRFTPLQLSRIISYIPQIYSITFEMDVFDFLLFSRFPHRGFFRNYSKNDIEKVHNISEKLGVNIFLKRKLNTLSGGELQKVMIASSLVQESEIILLDEPVTFLDPSSQIEIYNLLKELKEGGKTLIVVSHDLNIFSFFNGDVLGLKDGKSAFYVKKGDSEDLKYNLEKIFDVKFFKIERNNRVFFNFDV